MIFPCLQNISPPAQTHDTQRPGGANVTILHVIRRTATLTPLSASFAVRSALLLPDVPCRHELLREKKPLARTAALRT